MRVCWAAVREEAPGRDFLAFSAVFIVCFFCMLICSGLISGKLFCAM